MKRLIAVLSGLLVLPAFAEVAPIYYEDVIEYADGDVVDDEVVEAVEETVAEPETTAPAPVVKPASVSPRNTTTRTASRAMAAGGAKVASGRAGTNTRGVTTRTTTLGTTNASRAANARATVQRANRAATTTAQNSQTDSQNVTARRAVPTTGASAARSATTTSIVQTDTVSSPLYIGRVGARTNNASSVRARVPTIRIASSTSSTSETSESSTVTTTDMDELAQITDFCKAQYTQCMDNFCNVLDDNQGRCSCSANLKNYAKTEEALKQATEDLQDVAQKIQYIGLTADEVETLFTQTEAELQMQRGSDNTQLKNDLDKIKNMIVDVKSGSATTTDSGISLDLSGLLDFTISSTGFDLSSLFGGTNNSTSISNQRGEQLYKTATARCKASVLNSCVAQGVDASIITNAYDLEIDKQCIAYERSLTDTNDQMTATVRNAKSVLQKARLMVAQQKNQYDLRGCVNALDNCMQDDFVCGSDYENCLDPTGKYIVNGSVVIGSQPGESGKVDSVADGSLYATWKYNADDKTAKNAWATGGSISDYISATVTNTSARSSSTIMSNYLQTKIGYHDDDDGRDFGMCMSVLNKCQDVTYTGTGSKKEYNPTNKVITEYLARTLVQIKAKQDSVLADHAESCISDVTACLAQNNYDADKNTCSGTGVTGGKCPSAITGDIQVTLSANNKLAVRACLAMINTCISVNGVSGSPTGTTLTADQWVAAITSK